MASDGKWKVVFRRDTGLRLLFFSLWELSEWGWLKHGTGCWPTEEECLEEARAMKARLLADRKPEEVWEVEL